MEDFMSDFQRGKPHANPDHLFDNASDYLPRHLHPAIFKTFYKGYQAIFKVIHGYLSVTDLPLVIDVLQALVSQDTDVEFFLHKGGKVEYALDAVTAVVKEQSPLGDGTFEETWEDEEAVGRGYTGLVKCENDLEFDLVRRMVGLDPRLRWGPYYGPVQQADIDVLRRSGIPFNFDNIGDDFGDDDDDDDDEDEDKDDMMYEDMRGNMDPEIVAPNLAKIFGPRYF